MVYEFEVWIMPHHVGVDLIIGTDFMIPAGARLDLFNLTAKLPDKLAVPLLKSAKEVDEQEWGREVTGVYGNTMSIDQRVSDVLQLQRHQPPGSTHELWVRRLPALLPTDTYDMKGKASTIGLTNLPPRVTTCPAHLPIVVWMPHGTLPRDEEYVRLNSSKYRD